MASKAPRMAKMCLKIADVSMFCHFNALYRHHRDIITPYSCRGGHKLKNKYSNIKIRQELTSEMSKMSCNEMKCVCTIDINAVNIAVKEIPVCYIPAIFAFEVLAANQIQYKLMSIVSNLFLFTTVISILYALCIMAFHT